MTNKRNITKNILLILISCFLLAINTNFIKADEVEVIFSEWNDDGYTFIDYYDASIGQTITIKNGLLDEIGMILFDQNDNELGRIKEKADINNSNYYFNVKKDLSLSLNPNTDYKYQFIAYVNNDIYYSDVYSFKTLNDKVVFLLPERDEKLYIDKANARFNQYLEINNGELLEAGFYLYDSLKNEIGHLNKKPSYDGHYIFDLNEDLGITLNSGDSYYYRFYALVDDEVYYSDYHSFNAKGEKEIHVGIDVSCFQGTINWNEVSKHIDFAIIRCGYGGNVKKNDDDYFEYNVSECERLGIPYGVYLYSYAQNELEAEGEAKHVLRLLEGHKPVLPIFYDLEDSRTVEKLSNSNLLKVAKTFLNIIEENNYKVGIYANLNWWNKKLNSEELSSYPRWVAFYTNESFSDVNKYDIWQYTSKGKIKGIGGNVDINYWYTDSCIIHELKNIIIEPTCVNHGYTKHFCVKCGYSFIDNFKDPLGHKYDDEGICLRCIKSNEAIIRNNVINEEYNRQIMAIELGIVVIIILVFGIATLLLLKKRGKR